MTGSLVVKHQDHKNHLSMWCLRPPNVCDSAHKERVVQRCKCSTFRRRRSGSQMCTPDHRQHQRPTCRPLPPPRLVTVEVISKQIPERDRDNTWPMMNPMTVSAAVTNVANMRNLNRHMIPWQWRRRRRDMAAIEADRPEIVAKTFKK